MKKLSLLLSIIFFSFFATAQEWISISGQQPAPIQQKLLHSSEENIAIQFHLNGFYTNQVTTPAGKAVVISVPKMVSLSEAGAPDLPKYAVSSIIGDYAKMKAVVTHAEYTDFENMEIAPSKGDFSRKIDPESVAYTYGDAYETDAFFPSVNAELQTPFILRNYRGQAVTVMPFQYNPLTKTLRVYHNLTIELQKSGIGGENQFNTRTADIKEDREFKYIYDHMFINFSEAQTRYPILEEEGNFLIICHGAFMEAMEPFVSWKKTIGRPTEIVDVATIGTSPEAIKAFVTDYYNTNGLTHLLLVGDHQQVPSYNNTSSGGYSDYYYGYLSGNDSFNELFVGRFSAETVAHVESQVAKVITYERDLDESATWLNIGTGVARNEGAGGGHNGGESDYQHMDYIRDSLLNYTYVTVHREYDGNVPGVPNTNSTQISQRINDGTSIINYCNHGSQNSWSVANYSSSHVNQLTNTDRWPIIWSVACDNGRFTHGDCFAEAWMRATHNGQPTGAIGTLMSWVSQLWQPPMTGQDEMVTILVEGYENNIKRSFGGVSTNGSMRMIDLHGNSGRSTHDTWIVFGDPTLMLRTAPPTAISADYMPAVFLGMDEFTVNADADDAIVSLTIDGEIIGTGIIQDGSVTINFPALNNVGMMTVAIFGYNRVTHIGEIEIIPASGPFLAYVENLVNGAEGGSIHYGSTATLGVKIKNLGIEPATNIVATLSTTSPYVTITNSSANYGTLQPDEVLLIEDAFTIQLSNDVPNDTKLPFTLSMSSNEDNWESSFNLTALAPDLGVGSFTVNDQTGNGNGRLDPGETADILVSFTNNGSSQAVDAVATIDFSSEFITVNTGEYTIGAVNPGETKEAVFNISVSNSTPIGHPINFDFLVQAGAYSGEKEFMTKVGLILEDFETGDFTAFPYTHGGNQPWSVVATGAYEGTYCAKSGAISNQQSTQLILDYEVTTSDSISFYRKVSSESGYDHLRFYIDNVKVGEWSGNQAWAKVGYPVSEGNHTFKWEYIKDYIVSNGEDCAWIDYIVLPPTIVTNSYAGSDAAICQGETYQLNGHAMNYESFQWLTSGTGTFSNPHILNPIYTPSAQDEAAASVVLTLSVVGSSTTVESSMTLSINPMPEVFAGSTSYACQGVPVELTGATANSYASLIWTSSGSGEFADNTALHPTYIPSNEDYNLDKLVFTLEAVGIGTCGNSNSDVDLYFHELPTGILSGDQQVCEGGNAQLTVELSGQAPWTVELDNGLGTFDIAASPYTIEVTPETSTTYNLVQLVDGNNCPNTGSGQAVVEMVNEPMAPMTISAPDTVDLAHHSSTTITVEQVATALSYNYKLEPADAGSISGNTLEAVISWNEDYRGEARVYAAAVNVCGASDWSEPQTLEIISTVGLDEQTAQNLKIYPNPSNGRFTIDMNKLSSGQLRISVLNIIGELVYEESREVSHDQFFGEVNLEHLPNGIYMINLENNTSRSTQRISIKR